MLCPSKLRAEPNNPLKVFLDLESKILFCTSQGAQYNDKQMFKVYKMLTILIYNEHYSRLRKPCAFQSLYILLFTIYVYVGVCIDTHTHTLPGEQNAVVRKSCLMKLKGTIYNYL